MIESDTDTTIETLRRNSGSLASNQPSTQDKFTGDRVFELEEPQRPQGPSALSRFGSRYLRNHPRVAKWVLYLRGPRPKVDTPRKLYQSLDVEFSAEHSTAPVPLLNRDITPSTWRPRIPLPHFRIRLESAVLTYTRHLTSPLLLLVLAALYIISVSFISRASSFQTPDEAWLGCTSTFWLMDDGCGLNGESCTPFSNMTYDFRCPAQCRSVVLQNPRVVGTESVDFKPLIVGGGDGNHTYRGDTFICAAALQA
jgi:hypothetical protein